MTGKVFLIGAGPGDPDLITLKAVKALAQASVILIDDLVNPQLLQHAHHARVINVGKRGGCKSTPQHFINKLMISLATQGETVVRLKGGDPFLFGRGGEEMLVLRQAGITVDIIPGITSGIAAPATIGIPVTHRSCTHGVTFITGHTQDDSPLNWQALVDSKTTLVIYMGMRRLPDIVQALLTAGLPAETPAAAIQHGSLPQQQHVICPLNRLPMTVQQHTLGSPAILVIGEVVRLSNAHEVITTLVGAA